MERVKHRRRGTIEQKAGRSKNESTAYRIIPMLVVAVAVACSADGKQPVVKTIEQASTLNEGNECDVDLQLESLAQYAQKCEDATGIQVPAFDCDDGALVAEDHLKSSRCTRCWAIATTTSPH